MTIDYPTELPSIPELPAIQTRRASLGERISRNISPKKWLINYACKALDAADTVLGSIPVASVAAEIKEVVLKALPD